MDENLKLIKTLLRWVGEKSQRIERAIPRSGDRKATAVLEAVASRGYKFITSAELKNLLENEDSKNLDLLSRKRFLVLDPITKGGPTYVPVLTLKYDWEEGDRPELRMRLALFCIYKEELKAVGFRFETPEWPRRDIAGDPNHYYYHAQMITSHGLSRDWELPCDPWFPEVQPAFRLDADNEVGLFVCALFSIYGLEDGKSYLRNIPYSNRIKEKAERTFKDYSPPGRR